MSSLSATFGKSKHKYKIIFLIISLLLYGNTLKNGYGLDDEFVTGPQNITSKGFKAIPKVFKTFHVMDESGNNYEYRPIVKVSFAIEHGLWGENLMLSHLMNVLLYALCLIMLFNFLKRLFKEIDEFTIFFIVLVYAFLPIHAEVVASLKNRDVLLCFLFSFYGFTNILRYLDTKEIIKLVFAIVSFGLAFLSKFDVIPMIAIIPLVVFKKYKINAKAITLLIAGFVISLLIYKLTKGLLLDKKALQANRVYQYFENPLYYSNEFIDKISAGFNSLGFYVKMLIWPNKMICYYGYNTIPILTFTSGYALIGLVAASMMVYIFITRYKKPDMLWYGVVIFLGFISMYLNVAVPAAGIVAERFLFFASVGFCLIAIYFLLKMKRTKSKITSYKDLSMSQKSISIIVLLIFSVIVFNRNKEWKSKTVLFEADVKKYPESVKLSLLTTSQLIINISDPNKAKLIPDNEKVNKIREAENLLKNAIKTDSSCGGCYNNLSFMYLTFERKPEEALPYLKLGYKLDSTKKEVICNIGIAYFRMGQLAEAKKYLHLATKHDKKHDFSVPYEVLQDLYTRTDPAEGIEFFKKKLEEEHQLELMNVLLGKSYIEIRDTANSIYYYKAALFINPNNSAVSDFVTKLEVKFSKKGW